MKIESSRVLIRTDFGRYKWWPFLQLVDWIPKGCKYSTVIIYLTAKQNTELGAMLKATQHMLSILREKK